MKFLNIGIIGLTKSDEIIFRKQFENDAFLHFLNVDFDVADIFKLKIDVIVTFDSKFMYLETWIRCLHLNKISDFNIYHVSEYFFSDQKIKNPLVSVCTTSFNSGDKIFRPYQSLVSQSYSNWEWIIYDDSPKNSTNFELLTKISMSDARVKIYRSCDNKGIIGEVKYYSFRLARGDILIELDHDDELVYDCINTIVNVFKMYPNTDFVYTDFAELHEETFLPFRYRDGFCSGYGGYYKQYIDNKLLYVVSSPNINSKTIRNMACVPNHVRVWKSCFYDKIGGHNSRLPIADDLELIIRTFLYGEIIRIPKIGYLQYKNVDNQNLSIIKGQEILELQRIMVKSFEKRIHDKMMELGVENDESVKNCVLDFSITRPNMLDNYCNRIYRKNDLSVVIIMNHDIRKDLESLLLRNLEIIIIGNGCENLDVIIPKDSKIKWWNLDKCNDIVAINYALKYMTSGQYVVYLENLESSELDKISEMLKSYAFCLKKKDNVFAGVIKTINQTGVIKTNKINDYKLVAHRYDLIDKYGFWDGQIDLVNTWIQQGEKYITF